MPMLRGRAGRRTEGRAFANADGCEGRAGCQRQNYSAPVAGTRTHANPQWHGKRRYDPKLETATAAVKNGVNATVILDGRVPHAILLELFTELGAGTLIE